MNGYLPRLPRRFLCCCLVYSSISLATSGPLLSSTWACRPGERTLVTKWTLPVHSALRPANAYNQLGKTREEESRL